MPQNLTNTLIKNLVPTGKRVDVRDSGVVGLLLRMEPSGRKMFYVDVRHDGRRTSVRIGSADLLTIAQARSKAKEILARSALGEDPRPSHPDKSTITLRDFVQQFYAPWCIEHRKSGAATVGILLRMEDLLDRPCAELTRLELSAWRSKERSLTGNTAAALNRKVGALIAALNWGEKNGVLPDNPCRGLERLKETDSAAHVRYLSLDEVARLMKALEERETEIRRRRESANEWRAERQRDLLPPRPEHFADHLRPMVVLSLNTGIRRGSLFRLEWRDINMETRVMTIRAETAKSGKTYHVPLNAQAHETLRLWRDQTEAEGEGLVFPSPKGGTFDNCTTAWERVLKKAEIKNFRWHDMRHTFASYLVLAGADLNVVRELMGHASLAMTIRYAHLSPETKRAAVDRLGLLPKDT